MKKITCPCCGEYRKSSKHHVNPKIKGVRKGREDEMIYFCKLCHQGLHKVYANELLAKMSQKEQIEAAKTAMFGTPDMAEEVSLSSGKRLCTVNKKFYHRKRNVRHIIFDDGVNTITLEDD